MDQESLARIQQLIAAATDSFRRERRGSKRHAGVLDEGLRYELQLVSERLRLHLDRHHTEAQTFLDEQLP